MKKYGLRLFMAVALLLFGLYFFLFAAILRSEKRGSFFCSAPFFTQSAQNGAQTDQATASPSASQPGSARNPYSHYYYDRLTEPQKVTYIEMYRVISELEAQAFLTPVPQDTCEAAFCAICADHPELFWVTGFTAKYTGDALAPHQVLFLPSYTDTDTAPRTAELLQQRRSQLLEQMAQALGSEKTVTQRQKAEWLLQQLCNFTLYDESAPNKQQLRSCLLDGHSVCAGYTRALQYLFMGAGIEASFVSGTANGEEHAWLLAKLDGSWCYMDPTWSDTDCPAPSGSGNDLLHWEYTFIPGDLLALDHTPKLDIWPAAPDRDVLPRQLIAFESWQPEQLQQLIAAALQNHSADLCLWFTSESCWQQAITALERGDFAQMQAAAACTAAVPQPETVTYYRNDLRQVVQIVFSYP